MATSWSARTFYGDFSVKAVPCAVCGEPTGVRGQRCRFGRVVKGWVEVGMYCSNACRQKAYRQRRKALQESAARS